MGVYFGRADYVITDDHLTKARNKLRAVITSMDHGCWIVPPLGPHKAPARFMVNGEHDLCRRWSWRCFNGPIPSGHRIFMTCENRDCVKPKHMVAFKAEKSRKPRKIVRPKAKLNWQIVEEIRALDNPDVHAIAEHYEVHTSTIRNVLGRKTWITM